MRNLLDRRQSSLIASNNPISLNRAQLNLDAALGGFTASASDPIALASMTLGSLTFKLSKMAFLSSATSIGLNRAPRFLINGAANLFAVTSEVAAFRASNNFLGSLAGHQTQQGALDPNGFAGTLTDFIALKSIGHLGANSSTALTHFAQANAMVLGHEASAILGFTAHQDGSYIEKLFNAEAMNIALGAGTGVLSALTGGGIHRLERGIDARMSTLYASGHPFAGPSLSYVAESLIPRMSRNESPHLSKSHSRSRDYTARALGSLEGKVVVVANRGEAALRAATTAQRLGLKVVTLVSDADRGSWHANLPEAIPYHIGGNKIMESYGDLNKFRALIRQVARDLEISPDQLITHPLWGGFAEDPNLPRMLTEEGARFAGPSAEAMELLGPKTSSNEIAREAGLRPIPASNRVVYKTEADIVLAIQAETKGLEGDALAARSAEIRLQIESRNEEEREYARREFLRIFHEGEGQPVMIKGAETGGGRGIRVIERVEDFDRFFNEAVQESRETSPSADVFIAKYFRRAHHLEAQVIVDAAGNVRVMGIRECSLQRNQQKVQERDVTALLPPALRDYIIAQATAMLNKVKDHDPKGIGYTNAVTLEFLLDLAGLPENDPYSGDPAERLYVLEANTRLQVEHGVTEEAVRLRRADGSIEKLDFVELQLRVAAGEIFDFEQSDLFWKYATLQARINSEDPYNGFLPSPGLVTHLEYPADEEHIRVDRGVEKNREITPFYDSNIAKVMSIVEVPDGPVTPEVILGLNHVLADRMTHFLEHWEMAGVRSNVSFHRGLLRTPQVRNGLGYYTKFIENEFIPSPAGQRSYEQWNIAMVSAAIATYVGRREAAIAKLSAGRSIEDLSSMKMEIGGNEFGFEVRESGPGSYTLQMTQQKVEVLGLGSLKSSTTEEAIAFRRSRTGRFFIERDSQDFEITSADGQEYQIQNQRARRSHPANELKELKALAQDSFTLNESGQLVRSSNSEILDLVENAQGKTMIRVGEQAIGLQRSGEREFKLSIIDEKSLGGNSFEVTLEESIHEGERFQLIDLENFVHLQGEKVAVTQEAKGSWSGNYRGQKIALNPAKESHQYWALFSPSIQDVRLDIAGAIHTLTVGKKVYRTIVDSRQGKRYIQVGGMEYDINVADEGILSKDHVIAPLPGKITTPPALMPKVGDRVEEGQELLTEEAMKQKTAIRARQAGVIIAINVNSGDLIEPNKSLIVIGSANEDISPRRDSLPILESLPEDLLFKSFSRPPKEQVTADFKTAQGDALRRVSSYPETLGNLIRIYRQAALGYDVPANLLSESKSLVRELGKSDEGRALLIQALRGSPVKVEKEEEGPDGIKVKKSEVLYVGGLMDAISSIHILNHPLYAEQYQAFLISRDASRLSPPLAASLNAALSVYGVSSLERSPALSEALYRIHRAHRDIRTSNSAIGNAIELIRELELQELIPSLVNFQRSHFGGVVKGGIPLVHLAREAQSHLEAGTQEKSWSAQFDSLFEQAARDPQALHELTSTPRPTKRYLLRKMGSNSEAEVELATRILSERLYGNVDRAEGRQRTTGFRRVEGGFIRSFDSVEEGAIVSKNVVFVNAATVEEIGNAIERARDLLPSGQANIIEISVTQTPKDNSINDKTLQDDIAKASEGLGRVESITVSIPQSKAGNGPDAPAYRTYQPQGAKGRFEHHRLLDDIHPTDAWRIFELDRWREDFEVNRVNNVLLSGVYGFRVQDKKSAEADRRIEVSNRAGNKAQKADLDISKAGDRRNLIIAQVSGDITHRRFDATLAAQLIGAYNRFQKNPAEEFTAEEAQMIRAIPWGLKRAGLLPADFNPFSIELMQWPVQGIFNDHLSDPTTAVERIQRAAVALEGKIYSVPEAERQAENAALTLSRVQATTAKGPLDARIDIFIHAPLLADAEELAFTVGRWVGHFGDRRIDKTAIHYMQPEGSGYKEYVASVRTPARSRIDLDIVEVSKRGSQHRALSANDIRRKRLEAAKRNALYAPDRVDLLRNADVQRAVWPNDLAIPEDAVTTHELVLDKGKLVPSNREVGSNKEGMLVYEINAKFPLNMRGDTYERRMMWVGNDYSIRAGALGPVEGDIYEAAFVRAMEQNIPIHFASESSGAMMGFAANLFHKVRKTWSPEQKRWIIWATEAELNAPLTAKDTKHLRELVETGTQVSFGEEQGFEITSILSDVFLSTESLNASARTARVTALANKRIPVFGSAHGVTIGIGTYDWVLSVLNMIPVDAAAALTGPRAVTATGVGNYNTAQEYSDGQRLANAGIASMLVRGEREIAENILRLLSFLPSHRGEKPIIVDTGDSIDRDVAADFKKFIPADKNEVFNMRPVVESIFDQGPLGGVIELWKNFGPSALTGIARLKGRTVIYIFPQPLPDAVEGGRGPFIGSTLDYESSFKVVAAIKLAHQLGLPIVMDPAFSGFMPDAINVSRRVYAGGADIVRALEEFDGVIVQYLPDGAQWWGGCVAVSEKAINTAGNITTLSGSSAQAGILGSAGALEVPAVSRSLEEAFETNALANAIRVKLQSAVGPERVGLERELADIRSQISNQLATFYMLVNTASRAANKGTIDRIIQPNELGATRRIISDTLEAAIEAKNQREAQRAAQQAAWDLMIGFQTLSRLQNNVVPYTLEGGPEGQVKLCVTGSLKCYFGTAVDVLAEARRERVIQVRGASRRQRKKPK